MKVVLIKNFDSIGKKGEIKDVKLGYAQNFLFPQKFAVIATAENVNKINAEIKSAQSGKTKIVLKPNTLVNKLKGITLVFEEKADEAGHFFAGITREKIAKALEDKGLPVKGKQVRLEQPIKTAGEVKVEIDVVSGVIGEVRVLTKKI